MWCDRLPLCCSNLILLLHVRETVRTQGAGRRKGTGYRERASLCRRVCVRRENTGVEKCKRSLWKGKDSRGGSQGQRTSMTTAIPGAQCVFPAIIVSGRPLKDGLLLEFCVLWFLGTHLPLEAS